MMIGWLPMVIWWVLWIRHRKPYKRTREFVLPQCCIRGTYRVW